MLIIILYFFPVWENNVSMFPDGVIDVTIIRINWLYLGLQQLAILLMGYF